MAELDVGQGRFMVADESPQHGNHSPQGLGGTTVRITRIVADPDAAGERAVAAGRRLVDPVADQAWGWRQGRVVDPCGHNWEIGRPLR